MELISREAAIAAMKKATKEVGFNPFKVLNELPTVEVETMEVKAAIEDRDALCATVSCNRCDYRGSGCGLLTAKLISGLVQTYRKRKEEGKCN